MQKHCRNGQRWTMRLTGRLVSRLRTVCVIAGLGAINAGCASGVCTGWSAIYVSPDDKLTDGTAKQILKHDEYGARLKCPGFSPSGRG